MTKIPDKEVKKLIKTVFRRFAGLEAQLNAIRELGESGHPLALERLQGLKDSKTDNELEKYDRNYPDVTFDIWYSGARGALSTVLKYGFFRDINYEWPQRIHPERDRALGVLDSAIDCLKNTSAS